MISRMPKLDPTTDEFRAAGHRVVDWIADYRAHPECYPVLSRCRPGEIRAVITDMHLENISAMQVDPCSG